MSAAPKDNLEVLDGAALDDPKPVPGSFSMLDRSYRGIATRLPTRARSGRAHLAGFDAPQIAATHASVARESAGAVTTRPDA